MDKYQKFISDLIKNPDIFKTNCKSILDTSLCEIINNKYKLKKYDNKWMTYCQGYILNNKYIILIGENLDLYYSINKYNTVLDTLINKYFIKYDPSKYKYIMCDKFTNNFIISFILCYIEKLPTILYLYSIDICKIQSIDYSICSYDYPNIGTLDKINKYPYFYQYSRKTKINNSYLSADVIILESSIILDITKQIILTLKYLQDKLYFTHGQLIISNIILKDTKNNFKYKNYKINSNFTCLITDFSKSFIKFNDNHLLYNRLWLQSELIPILPYTTNVKNSEMYYNFNENITKEIYLESLSYGIMLYPSIDVYIFLISLFLNPIIFYTIYHDKILQEKLWLSLFFEDDLNTVLNIIQDYIITNTENNLCIVFKILKKFKLKYNIIDILLQKLFY